VPINGFPAPVTEPVWPEPMGNTSIRPLRQDSGTARFCHRRLLNKPTPASSHSEVVGSRRWYGVQFCGKMRAASGGSLEINRFAESSVASEHTNRSVDPVTMCGRLTSDPAACYALLAGQLLYVAGSSVDCPKGVSATSAETTPRGGSRMMPERCLRRALTDSSSCAARRSDLSGAIAAAVQTDRPPSEARRRSPCSAARLVPATQTTTVTPTLDSYKIHRHGRPRMSGSIQLGVPRLAPTSPRWSSRGDIRTTQRPLRSEHPDQSCDVSRKRIESRD